MNVIAILKTHEAGYERDKEAVKDFEIGQQFAVAEISMGSYSTSIKLKEVPGKSFNSVFFQFMNEMGDEIDIYTMSEFNPYMR